jgi:hypothetical protein
LGGGRPFAAPPPRPPRRRWQLLNDAGADAFAMDASLRTPLLEAAAAGSAPCIRFLAEECGVPVREEIVPEESASGEHALLLAAGGGHAAAVGVLLELGAKVNRTDREGRSALWAAARWARGRGAEPCLGSTHWLHEAVYVLRLR